MSPAVVLLAAGRSNRTVATLGVAKGLIQVDGQPWIALQCRRLLEFGTRVIVVLGHHAAELEAACEGLDITVVHNPDPDRGPFSSLQVGLQAVNGGAFVLPLDVPCPTAEVFDALAGRAPAAIPVHEGRGGHPVWLDPALATQLRALDPTHEDSRLDVQLRAAGAVRIEVSDPRVVENLNTPADWELQKVR